MQCRELDIFKIFQEIVWKLFGFLEEFFGTFWNFWRIFFRGFLEEYFWRNFFWRNVLGENSLEDFFRGIFVRIFLGEIFWEDFLGGFFGRIFLGGITK